MAMTREHVFGGNRTLSPVGVNLASNQSTGTATRSGRGTGAHQGTATGPADAPPDTPALPAQPGLIHIDDLPGRLSLALLVRLGIVTVLDRSTCYLNEAAGGIFGRASIVNPLLPFGAAACGSLALWVWMSGEFPEALDIISNSHFRAPVLGRPLRPHNRKLNPQYLMRVGELWVTSPLWTACDLACEEANPLNGFSRKERILELMDRYRISCPECLDLLSANPRWPGHATGVRVFTDLKDLL